MAVPYGARADRRRQTALRAPVPVVCVGNVTAGGAGKTPTVCALVPLLAALGFTPHILTRGYQSHGLPAARRVDANDDWRQVGDEAMLLSRIAPTWVGCDRIASARAAAAAGATMAVCDDGLQHHRLHKDVSLLVIDGPYGVGNGRLLPAGPLREPLTDTAARSDAVILIGADAHQLATTFSIPVFRATLLPVTDTGFLTGHRWLAFAGIGRPEKFFTSLRESGAILAGTRAFPDHHPYSAAECAGLLAQADRLGARLVTTEKDAVKLPPGMRAAVSLLPVRLAFENPAGLQAFLHDRLALHQSP